MGNTGLMESTVARSARRKDFPVSPRHGHDIGLDDRADPHLHLHGLRLALASVKMQAMPWSRPVRSSSFVIAAFSLLLYTGCNVPTVRKGRFACCPRSVLPLVKEVEVGMAMNALPPALRRFETGASGNGLFWARWYQQTSQVVWVGGPDHRSYFPPGQGWELVNFVATYDANGTLNRYGYCSESELKKCLQMIETISFEERARTPLEFTASRNGRADFQGTIVFSSDRAVLQGTRHAGTPLERSIVLQYPIKNVSAMPVLSEHSTQGTISLIIILKGGPGPDRVNVSASPPETRSLIAMLASGHRMP